MTQFCATIQQVSEEQVRDLLVTALEGGSNYWIENTHYELREGLQYSDFQPGGSQTLDEYFHPLELIPFVEGCSLIIQVIDEGDGFDGIQQLTRDKMMEGVKVMAADYSQHFQDFLEEDGDANTGDVFLQCCLFGKVVFG